MHGDATPPRAPAGAEQAGDVRATARSALARAVRYLDRELAPAAKVRAFRRADEIIAGLTAEQLVARVESGTLTDLDGIGASTSSVIVDAVIGGPGTYLAELEARSAVPVGEGAAVRAALRGDCHSHSTWSDGGASIEEMALAARELGHEYLVITDHSARLTVAHGLSEERLASQLDEIAEVAERVAPFRILTGLEVDILADGTLDLSDEMLARLDVVVASVHSKFTMPPEEMTKRMVRAIAHPGVDILGHLTNRKVSGRGRPPSRFDADMVFAACARFGTAVEINCRPERQDPPDELMEIANQWECEFAISTDAHAPGQLEWQPYGCDKAARHGVPLERIVNTRSADELRHRPDR